MILTSKIKTMFSPECLIALGKLCDTMRIPSIQTKMKYAQGIIKRYNPELRFGLLGGATNRLVIFSGGMPVKIALDSQGYKDNLMEYSIGPELQPFVPKPYETNGYILVCAPWKLMTQEEWSLRKPEIMRVLDTMAQDYLLGDVGYIKRNFTNWGIDDDGNVGILDYAYIHRATPNLFTCEVCGNGILRYDSSYSRLKCSNSTVCNAKYTYIERKMIQGEQVDLDMIAEVTSESIMLKGDKTSIEVINNDGVLINGNKRVIRTKEEYWSYMKERLNMNNFDSAEALDLLISQLDANAEENDKIEKKLMEIVEESEEEVIDGEVVETIIEYNPEEDDEEEEDCDEEIFDEVDADYALSMDDLLSQLSPTYQSVSYEDNLIPIGGKDDKVELSPDAVELVEEDNDTGVDGISIGGVKKRKVPEEVKPIQVDTVEDTDTCEDDMTKMEEIQISDDILKAVCEAAIENAIADFQHAVETDTVDELVESTKNNDVVSVEFRGVTLNDVPVTE